MPHSQTPKRLWIALCSLILTVGGAFFALNGGVGSAGAQGAPVPTMQPTETAVPLVTPTRLPQFAPITVPAWDDVAVHKRAMKPEYTADVDRFADGIRYLIAAHLTFEPDAVIRGAARVRYLNRSAESLNEIVFRLYANTPALGGRMVIQKVVVTRQGNMPVDTPIEPSLAALGTVMGVPLPKPLAPGEDVEFVIDFATIMRRGLNTSYGRFGYVNEVVSATAWYPTLSVYEPGNGWWISMPSPRGDPAYTETGLYDVRLTVPKDLTVAASGTIIEQQQNADGTTTYRDVTGPMRDHAFQASARYEISSTTAEGVRINAVHYKSRPNNTADGTTQALKYGVQAIQIFSKTFGPYPYAELDIAQNPTPSGVEFPGLIQIADRAWTQGSGYLEVVIAHEVGHQWFYSLVGNNQVELPWLDESLTSYSEFVYVRTYATAEQATAYVNDFRKRYVNYTGSGKTDLPLNLPVERYINATYGVIVYTKGPLFLVELERELGQETVYKALAEYFRRMRYGVAQTEDLKKALEDVSGRDLTALFRKWVG